MGATSPLHHLNHNHNNNNGRSSAGPTPPSLPSPGGTDSQGSSVGGQSGGMGPGGPMMAPPSPATTPQPMNSSNHQQQQPSPVSGLTQPQQNHLQQQQPSPQQRLQVGLSFLNRHCLFRLVYYLFPGVALWRIKCLSVQTYMHVSGEILMNKWTSLPRVITNILRSKKVGIKQCQWAVLPEKKA